MGGDGEKVPHVLNNSLHVGFLVSHFWLCYLKENYNSPGDY